RPADGPPHRRGPGLLPDRLLLLGGVHGVALSAPDRRRPPGGPTTKLVPGRLHRAARRPDPLPGGAAPPALRRALHPATRLAPASLVPERTVRGPAAARSRPLRAAPRPRPGHRG